MLVPAVKSCLTLRLGTCISLEVSDVPFAGYKFAAPQTSVLQGNISEG